MSSPKKNSCSTPVPILMIIQDVCLSESYAIVIPSVVFHPILMITLMCVRIEYIVWCCVTRIEYTVWCCVTRIACDTGTSCSSLCGYPKLGFFKYFLYIILWCYVTRIALPDCHHLGLRARVCEDTPKTVDLCVRWFIFEFLFEHAHLLNFILCYCLLCCF